MKARRPAWRTEMLRIPCPHCGVRDEPEFVFGGPANLVRPPSDTDDVTWTNYLFVRENPVGVHVERWLHAYGCRQWFHVSRDSLTHQISSCCALNESLPELPLARTREGA
jgi:sarcosine oxidase subunit delta